MFLRHVAVRLGDFYLLIFGKVLLFSQAVVWPNKSAFKRVTLCGTLIILLHFVALASRVEVGF
jgi:hypothetical protein